MGRSVTALFILATAGCSTPTLPLADAKGHFVLSDGSTFNAHVERLDEETWMLTVGHGGDFENTPQIFLDGKRVELKASSLTGFGLYDEAKYVLPRRGAYRIEQRDATGDEKPRAVFSFTIRQRQGFSPRQ